MVCFRVNLAKNIVFFAFEQIFSPPLMQGSEQKRVLTMQL
jgi:hypothetical protein